ncbi:MAG: hypothetical protein ACRBDX_11605 [Gammaproteobacteria bacterium]
MQRLLLTLLFLPSISFANCTQETIQYYLDKGFNQEQITKLCTTTTKETESYQPYQKQVVIVQGTDQVDANGLSADERKAVNALRGGIDGRSVEVTPENINYIRKVCTQWKASPDVNKWVTKCIDVAFSVSRVDLKVNESSKGKILYGQTGLVVSSAEIKRKYVTADPWKNLPPDLRVKLKRKHEDREKGNTTKSEFRKTAEPGQMVNAIRTLADATKAKQSGDTTTEVSRILDDSYTPPTEEEYLASQASPEEAREEKKKNKKWWNPFD